MLAKKSLDSYWQPNVYVCKNETISTSITQTWTPQAIECYELNGNCKECSIQQAGYSFICQMPKVIKHLIECVGEPAY